jgi:hypothetical protein
VVEGNIMMTSTDYVVTRPFFSSNGASGIVEFLPGDHLFLLGPGYDPGFLRALRSRGPTRETTLFFERSDMHTFVRVCRQV